MKERKQMPDWLCGLIIFLIFLIVAGGSLVFCVVYPQKRYEKICSNVPSESWFEQDLKVVFYDKEMEEKVEWLGWEKVILLKVSV